MKRVILAGLLSLSACSPGMVKLCEENRFLDEAREERSFSINFGDKKPALGLNLYLESPDGEIVSFAGLNDFGNKLFTGKFEHGRIAARATPYWRERIGPAELFRRFLKARYGAGCHHPEPPTKRRLAKL